LLTLNRPDSKNAFNDDLYHSVRRALDEAKADPAVAVCVITGTGDLFSAGQDLKAVANFRDEPEAGQAFGPFSQSLATFDKPLIAAVNGAAVGIGTTMLLHCDLVLVSDTARFKLPFVSLGFVPEAASSVLLPTVIGPQAANHLLLTGAWMDAEEAVARGLAWKRVSPDQLLDQALGLARQIATAPVEHLVASKRMLLAARADAVSAALSREQGELDRIVTRLRG
jgi:enoyl-CoA hydratase/carnithine racemase